MDLYVIVLSWNGDDPHAIPVRWTFVNQKQLIYIIRTATCSPVFAERSTVIDRV